MRKIAVLLSGCGYKDGAEITEAVATLVALGEEGVSYQVFSLDKEIERVNHLSDQSAGVSNLLAESTRITRTPVIDCESLVVEDFDGVVFPGGFGVAKYFCDFASKGAACTVEPVIEKIIKDFHAQSKPIAAFCIAPALIAKVLGREGVEVTIGNDEGTSKQIEKAGASHVDCEVDDYVTDRANKVITSPAYMYDGTPPHKVFLGIRRALREFVEMS